MSRKGVWLGIVVAVLVTAVGAPSSPVAAHEGHGAEQRQRQRQIAAEVERLEGEVDEVAAEEARVLAELEVSRRVAARLDDQLAAVAAQLDQAAVALERARREVVAADVAHRRAERRVEVARRELAESRQRLRDQAVTAFMRLGRGRADVDVLLQVRDVAELHQVAAYVGAVAERQVDEVDRHRALREDTERLEARADVAAAAAEGRRDALADQHAELEALRAERAAARAAAREEAHHEAALLDAARSRRADFEGRIAALQRESDQISALLARLQRQQQVRPRGSGTLGLPIPGAAVTSGFGYRTHPIFGSRRLHAGIDLRARSGTPILAAGDGVVAFAGPRGGYGNAVVIDHGGALATLYAHQSRLAVADGARVRRGQVIGAVGSTGFSTGPHLHFEVRVGGTPVDPLGYL